MEIIELPTDRRSLPQTAMNVFTAWPRK